MRTITLHQTSLQGKRESNEDTEEYFLNLNNNGTVYNNKLAPIDFFAICDGHGGKEVAKYIAPRLKKYLTDSKNEYPLSKDQIKNIYNHIQRELIDHPDDIARACGCTALVVIRFVENLHFLEPERVEYIQVINLGDCRAVLSRDGIAIPLCKDHKPFWPDEKKRIDMVNKKYRTNNRIHFDAGDWRIGDLSVSRSFGDLDNTPYVSHLPDSFIYKINPQDEFIIMACDGLWDVVQNHEAVNFVRDHMNDNEIQYYDIPNYYPSPEAIKARSIARKLASYAIAKGSTDNVSIYIIFLG